LGIWINLGIAEPVFLCTTPGHPSRLPPPRKRIPPRLVTLFGW
jgi:hypothetical protein